MMAMKHTRLILAAVAVSLACSAKAGDVQQPLEIRQAVATITPDDIHHSIAFLASDALEGRDTPSRGLETAADWIARTFEAAGLEPGTPDGWLQRYPYPSEGLDVRDTHVEVSGGATHALEYGAEFFALPGATFGPAAGVVFVASLDALDRGPDGGLRDRAVLVRLDGSIEQARGGPRLDARARERVARAMAHARDARAAALIFVLDERITRSDVAALAETAAAPSRVLGGRAVRDDQAAFFITHAAAARMFRMAGLDGAAWLRRGGFDRPAPLPGITVRLAAPVRALDQAEPPNVVAVLRGTDPVLRDSYVVISAHMDHVGMGAPDETGDSIYNGADDNASGTAALLAIARAFSTLPQPPARSILFLAVSGEEKGLLGSRWFAENPTVPIGDIVANINLDMIGRNAPDTIVVIGKEYSSLGPLVREVARTNPDLGLTVAPDPWPEERFFFRSDHYSFAARGIPALFFFAGTHEDYHRPGDQVHKIDFDKTARVARLAFLVALEVAQRTDPPSWDAGRLEEVRAMTRARD
jgi:hypothetical protein